MSVVAHLDPYPFGDSAAGIERAGELEADGIDLNARTCRAVKGWRQRKRRRIVLIHNSDWWRHGWEPIPGKRVPRRKIENLNLAQVKNLRSKVGHHRVQTLEEAVDVCKVVEVVPCPELKPSIWTLAVIQAAIDYAAAAGVPLVWMTVQAYGKTERAKDRWEDAAVQRLTLVDQAGGWSVLQWRRRVDWDEWGPILDGVKSVPHGFRVPPRHTSVVRIGTLLQRLRRRAGWRP